MLLPNTIKTGKAIGKVIIAPRTDPLLRLNEFPSTKRLRKIYELIIAKGNINKLKDKFSVVPSEKIKLNSEMGIPINNQWIKTLNPTK